MCHVAHAHETAEVTGSFAAPAGRLPLLLVCGALAVVWLVMLLFGGGVLDRQIAVALYAGGQPAWIRVALIARVLGEPTVLIGASILVAAWLAWRGRGHAALGFLLVVMVGRGLTETQKYWIARPRPQVEPHLIMVQTSSFPSGHATSSMIFYLTLALALVPRGGLRGVAAATAIALALVIGTSRVMLGVHWPSDVIAGWSFGLLWVLIAWPPTDRLLLAHSRTSVQRV